MTLGARNDIFDQRLFEWRLPDGSGSVEHPPGSSFLYDNPFDPVGWRDWDPPEGTLRVFNEGPGAGLTIYERTYVPVHGETPQDATPDGKKLIKFNYYYPSLPSDFMSSTEQQRNPRRAPNGVLDDGPTMPNLLWSPAASNNYEPSSGAVPAGFQQNPWLEVEEPVATRVTNPTDPSRSADILFPGSPAGIRIWDQRDSLRAKAMKCLSVALILARATWSLKLDDGEYVLERPYRDMDLFRGFSNPPDVNPQAYTVVLNERAVLEVDERIRQTAHALGVADGNQVFEILVTGWAPNRRELLPFRGTDDVYPFMEAIRGRLASLVSDANHPKRILRIARKNNAIMQMSPGDGTVHNEGDPGAPGFFLRLLAFPVESLADSTYDGAIIGG